MARDDLLKLLRLEAQAVFGRDKRRFLLRGV